MIRCYVGLAMRASFVARESAGIDSSRSTPSALCPARSSSTGRYRVLQGAPVYFPFSEGWYTVVGKRHASLWSHECTKSSGNPFRFRADLWPPVGRDGLPIHL